MVVILPAQYLATQKFDVTRAALLRAFFFWKTIMSTPVIKSVISAHFAWL